MGIHDFQDQLRSLRSRTDITAAMVDHATFRNGYLQWVMGLTPNGLSVREGRWWRCVSLVQ